MILEDFLMIKYIIALLALQPQGYVDYAQNHFAPHSAEYLLGSNSHPHITLAQFYGTPENYAKICQELEAIQDVPEPQFTGLSFIQDKKDSDIWWTEFSAAREQKLLQLQRKITTIVESKKLELLNDKEDLYRPHLTLARIRQGNISYPLQTIPSSSFILVIGEADERGQFIKVLKKFKSATT